MSLLGRFTMGRVVGVFVGVFVMCCGLLGVGSVSALAVSAPAWGVTVAGVPSVLPPGLGRVGKYDVAVENVGGANSEGIVEVRDYLPAGLLIKRLGLEPKSSILGCTENGSAVTGIELVCSFAEPVVPSGFIVVNIEFTVASAVGSLVNHVNVTGGGGALVSATDSTRLGGEHEKGPAGIAGFGFHATGPAGEPVTQASGHPNLLTTSVLFNNMFAEGANEPAKPVEAVKDLAFYLPLGMLGNTTVADTCPASIVETKLGATGCPPGSRVGTVLAMLLSAVFANTPGPTNEHGIFNVTPEKGYAAEFAFTANNYTFFIYASVVRHDGAYMLRVATPGVPQISYLIGLVASFYGSIQENYVNGAEEFSFNRGSFLTNPSDCGEGPQERQTSVALDTWEHPDSTLPLSESVPAFSAISGCGLLGFSAGLSVTPETTQADAPSGYEVSLEVPQAPNDPAGLGTPPVKDVSVTLPEGTTISPSSANGLGACEETGPNGIDIEGVESEGIGADGLPAPVAGHCPLASQIATVTATTPLLHETLTGHLFLATPQCGGSGQPECTEEDARNGNLFGLYIELEGPGTGVIIKLKGHASVDPVTGRITADFDENPQFPFGKLDVAMKRGERAPLANSQVCGPAVTTSTITPWSSPATPAAVPSDMFTVDENGAGGACPATPFAPAFTAGTTNPLAGSTSPFTLTLKREDREQDIASISSTLPEGLLANLPKVTKCPESLASQASLTACPATSLIGSTTVSAGPGSDPYTVTGKVFFTGPYGGAPFGLSVIVPAVAGPFNLGNVLVRVALFVDPHTSQVTAVSGPLPQKLDGVPLRLRTINLTVSNSQFVLNPTNCTQLHITGTIYSTTGGKASVSSPFLAAGCKNLAFKPTLSASTEARSTKASGTGVKVKISYPTEGTTEANIAKVVLSFPKQLPVRLETLQQACRAAIFEANPANCPPGSNIGTATVHTPILGVPLVGPAYLVSYGSAKFPDVVFVLQGEGVTLDVDGQSFVSHAGVLKVTFASVPDAPFSSFETVLPAGRYSQFTNVKSTAQAVASQCGEDLVAPVTMVAQNGAEVSQNAKLQVTGCGPAVSLKAAHASSSGLTVTVNTSVKGRLSISGPGLKTLVKKSVAAGEHKLMVALTAAGRNAARAHRKVQVSVGLVAGKKKASGRKKFVL